MNDDLYQNCTNTLKIIKLSDKKSTLRESIFMMTQFCANNGICTHTHTFHQFINRLTNSPFFLVKWFAVLFVLHVYFLTNNCTCFKLFGIYHVTRTYVQYDSQIKRTKFHKSLSLLSIAPSLYRYLACL